MFVPAAGTGASGGEVVGGPEAGVGVDCVCPGAWASSIACARAKPVKHSVKRSVCSLKDRDCREVITLVLVAGSAPLLYLSPGFLATMTLTG